jgi:hypothetical protein
MEWKATGITRSFQNVQNVSFWHIAEAALPWQRERTEIFTVMIRSVGEKSVMCFSTSFESDFSN